MFPFDLLILVPSSARTMEWTLTFLNGTSPRKRKPIIIIRATHRYMISRAVERRLVG